MHRPCWKCAARSICAATTFEKLNERQRERGDKTFVNPRNTAAGAIRQLDPALVRQRPLCFYAYGLGEVRGWDIPGHAC